MSLLKRSFTVNIGTALSALCPCSSRRKRKASSDLVCGKSKRLKVEPIKRVLLLEEFPHELLSLICHEIDDDDLLALMRASNLFAPSAAETLCSRLEERGIIQYFLGTVKVLLPVDLDDTLTSFLTEFFPLAKVAVDCDFWALLHLNQTICRIIQKVQALSSIRIRLHSTEVTLLQDDHCMPAMDSLWKALGSRTLENVELICDDRDPPHRPEGENVYQPITPVAQAPAPIQARYLEISTVFTQPCRNKTQILQPLLHSSFPTILWIHVHPIYKAFDWDNVRLDGLFSLWIITDRHIRIRPSFYKSHPRLSSISTVAPFSLSSPTPQPPLRNLTGANVVQPDLRRLSTSPNIGWKLGKKCVLESLEITARDPWEFEDFLNGYRGNSVRFCEKVKGMTAVFRGIPARRLTRTRIDFEFPRGVADHCSAFQTEDDRGCSCSLRATGVESLLWVRFQFDHLTEVVYCFISKLLCEFRGVRDLELSVLRCGTTVDQERKFILGLRSKLRLVQVIKTPHGTWSMSDNPRLI
ncbi:hypothetical protein NP233_g768 [Leucocoprinus birnbaumii]|uniref:F-box domain-containing protein n=1 Tax=Leucocoprinus birnbaumii TaxID=56174 RepID=A0AAD5W1R9_9AGAR|nr:hypothetical protein NP233_g768 [Leucocoprinus birnbaumii]